MVYSMCFEQYYVCVLGTKLTVYSYAELSGRVNRFIYFYWIGYARHFVLLLQYFMIY